MAKIGVQDFKYSILTEDNNGYSYGEVKSPGHAIEMTCDVTSNSAVLYGDNVQIESDYTFQKAAIKMTIDRADDQVMHDLLGHTYEGGELTRNSNDRAPYVGISRIANLIVGNKSYYRVEFLFKVKFSEPSQDDKTKGESVEFGTYELNGEATTLDNGDWSKAKTFETREEAEEYITSLYHPYPSA